jgi:hypothetical protein
MDKISVMRTKLWSMDLRTTHTFINYANKIYGQMDLQTKYVHVQNLWSNGPSN